MIVRGVEGGRVPFRSKELLQAWLDEFAASGVSGGGVAVVVDQEAVGGRDSGLVVYPLRNATTSVYMQPLAPGVAEWRVTIEEQPEATELSPEGLYDLCRELSSVADLCAFLQLKSVEHLEQDTSRA